LKSLLFLDFATDLIKKNGAILVANVRVLIIFRESKKSP